MDAQKVVSSRNPMCLEHGDSGPVIVAQDANPDDATPRIIKGRFYHADQVYVSVQRIFSG